MLKTGAKADAGAGAGADAAGAGASADAPVLMPVLESEKWPRQRLNNPRRDTRGVSNDSILFFLSSHSNSRY
jgi:hypothetical protein